MEQSIQLFLDADKDLLGFGLTFFDDLRTICLGNMNRYVRNHVMGTKNGPNGTPPRQIERATGVPRSIVGRA